MIEDGPEDERKPEAPAPDEAELAPEHHDLPAAALLDPPEAPAPDEPPVEVPPEPAPPEPDDPEPVPSRPVEPPPVEEPPPTPELPEAQISPPPDIPAPPAPAPEIVPVQRRGGVWRRIRRIMALLLIVALIGPPLSVIAYQFIPPPLTWLMVERLVQGQGLTKHWTSLGDIDPSLPNAVIAGEDANFCTHHGFDFQALQAAMRANARHPGKVRGGSTISQQVAKNVFLWPSRDYLRKGLEAYYTVLIEALWGKRRIMEMYLNEVEWGPGTYGAQAAAQRYFNEPASDIDPGEASRLAAILPSR